MIHAILLCRDARRNDSGYWEDVYEEIDAETSLDLLAKAAAQVSEDADVSDASLFLRHDTLTSKLLPAAVDTHRAEQERRKKEEQERARQATKAAAAKRREAARAQKAAALRQKLADIESGAELERLRRELADVESGSLAAGGEA